MSCSGAEHPVRHARTVLSGTLLGVLRDSKSLSQLLYVGSQRKFLRHSQVCQTNIEVNDSWFVLHLASPDFSNPRPHLAASQQVLIGQRTGISTSVFYLRSTEHVASASFP